jgi:hypothetical protein
VFSLGGRQDAGTWSGIGAGLEEIVGRRGGRPWIFIINSQSVVEPSLAVEIAP